MTLISALVLISAASLLTTNLVHEHINQQTIWKNYKHSWNIIHKLEQDQLHVVNGTKLANSTVSLIEQKFIPDLLQSDRSSGIQLQHFILRDTQNPKYELYFVIQRRIDNFEALTTNAKIIAWHFGA